MSITIDIPKNKEMEIQLHLTEYNALTMRETYLINIQYLVLGSVVVWVTVMGVKYLSEPGSFIGWGSVFVSQIFCMISAWLLNEEFLIVDYIEFHIRPTLVKLLDNKELWKYQYFLQNRRKKTSKKWEFTGLIFIVPGLIAVGVLTAKNGWSDWDYLGLFVNLVGLWLYILRLWKALKIKWDWEDVMRKNEEELY
jgi:hypothetical protein